MAYTAQNLEHAVSVFYSSEHSDRAEAHKWLTAAQRCPEAWSFVWELLQSQKGTEIQFFAATTLHTKLQRCWAEVPPDNYLELKNRILEAIAMFSRGPKLVLNRLCISLAAFLLQQNGQSIIETLEPLMSSDNPIIVLEILAVIPEEFNSMTMAASKRAVVRNYLQQLTLQVLDVVTQHLTINAQRLPMYQEEWSHKVNVWQSSCQCASAWLELGGVEPLSCAPLLTAALQVLHAVYWGPPPCRMDESRELSSSEFETCESALNVVTAALTQPDAAKYSNSCQSLIRLLLDAVEPILQTQDVVNSPNDELVTAIYAALVAVGECHAQWISSALSEDEASTHGRPRSAGDDKQIQSKRDAARCAQDLVRLILRCSDAPGVYPTQETHSHLAFGFWYILQDEALRDIPGTMGDGCFKKIALRGWYEQLANALLRKSTFLTPPATYSAEDAEQMRCYRQDIADILLYCYTVLGPSLLQQLSSLLERLSSSISTPSPSPAVVCQLEAVLHAFLALGEAAGAAGPNAPTLLLSTLLTLPYHAVNQQLLITALDCFSAYAEWLESEDAANVAGGLVGGALSVACGALTIPTVAPRAALALRTLTEECYSQLSPHAVTLLASIQACQNSLAGGVCVKVLSAAGSAASSMNPSAAAPHMIALTTPIVNSLRIAQKQQLTEEESQECKYALHQASALMEGVCMGKWAHAQVPLSILMPSLVQSAKHTKLAEPLFSLVRLVMNVLWDECIPLLPDLSNILNLGLKDEPHPTAVYVAKLMSLMFPNECGSMISVAACSVMKQCKIAVESGRSLSELSPLLDVLYSSLTSVLSKNVKLLDHMQDDVQSVIQLGIIAMSLPEQGPRRACCSFFGQLAKVKPELLYSHAPALVHRCIHCIGILTPRSHIDTFAEVFIGLGKAQWGEDESSKGPAMLRIWMREALQHPGFPSDLATPQVKENFVNAVIKHHGHKRQVVETIRGFALTCRGLSGEYGQVTQSTTLP